MDGKEASNYKISIPFAAFLTANSILIAADFILLQLWFNFQPTPNPDQVLESISVGTIFVSFFVVVSIVSMIIAILDRINNEVKGRPIILFLFSLFFTMCFVFQSIVTLLIKTWKKLPSNTTLYNPDDFVYFGIALVIASAVIILSIVKPIWWDKLFWFYQKHIIFLLWAIFGILIGVAGAIFIIGRQSICRGAIIGVALTVISIVLVALPLLCQLRRAVIAWINTKVRLKRIQVDNS